MILVAAGIFIAYIVTFFLMPFIIRVAKINKLYDIPDERKTHKHPVSSLGGIGIVAGLSLSLLLVTDFRSGDASFQYYIACFFIIFTLGVIDDLFVLHPLKKIAGQLLVALILTTKSHLLLTNLQGLGGVYEISSATSYAVTFFTILLVINSFNLIDGVDGLAASLGLLSSLVFGLFFYSYGNMPYAILGFAMAGSLLAFLVFNFPPARIFMGDSGSMLIGVVNAILLLKFIETGNGNISSGLTIHSPIALGFGILLVPLMDVLRVFIIRLTNGKSPFSADRNHLHHLLLNKGFTHLQVTIALMLFTLMFSGVAYYINSVNINLAAAILIMSFFSIVFAIKYFASPRKLQIIEGEETGSADLQNIKVLSLYETNENVSINNREKTNSITIELAQSKKKAEPVK